MRFGPREATSMSNEPLGVRLCDDSGASIPASNNSLWYTLARRNTLRSRCGSFAPRLDCGTASSARKTPMTYSDALTKFAARARPCVRDDNIPTHST